MTINLMNSDGVHSASRRILRIAARSWLGVSRLQLEITIWGKTVSSMRALASWRMCRRKWRSKTGNEVSMLRAMSINVKNGWNTSGFTRTSGKNR